VFNADVSKACRDLKLFAIKKLVGTKELSYPALSFNQMDLVKVI